MDGAGIIRWAAEDVAICVAADYQNYVRPIPDGSGGAILAWEDFRGSATDIFAQRVDANGAVQCTDDGVAI